MKLQSMTGFGRGEASDEEYTVTVELKSVNHRFKDYRFKMPSLFSSQEQTLKQLLNEKLQRGSLDIYVSYKRVEGKSRFDDLDYSKIEEFLEKLAARTKKMGLGLSVQPTEFLRHEFMKDQEALLTSSLPERLVEAFKSALNQLVQAREEEGEKLKKTLIGHLETYEACLKSIQEQAPTFQASVEERLKKRFAEYGQELGVEEPRFMQEVVFYLEKMDIHEELDRIGSHLQKLRALLESGQEVGRQIDFMIQELNRETNTIGSKSSLKDISETVVQMKVQLEKVREQGLNLE